MAKMSGAITRSLRPMQLYARLAVSPQKELKHLAVVFQKQSVMVGTKRCPVVIKLSFCTNNRERQRCRFVMARCFFPGPFRFGGTRYLIVEPLFTPTNLSRLL